MKIFALLFWTICLPLLAKEEPSAADKVTTAAIGRLEKRIDTAFTISFPKEWDIEVYRKQPIALLTVEGGKISATRPLVNPYDGAGTIEWMLGPEDPAQMPGVNLDCFLNLDEAGEFFQMSLLCHADDWPKDDRSSHQLRRRDDESGPAFFKLAMETYRLRAKKAKNPAQAALMLAGFEKIATALHALRKEEAMRSKD